MINITQDSKNLELIKNNMLEAFEEFLNSRDSLALDLLIASESERNKIVEVFLNALIKTEFEMFMGYKKYERTGLEKTNYRNGNHKKIFKTSNGEMTLTIPEDRNSEFDPTTVPKHMRRSEDITRAIIQLFSMGNSNAQVVTFCDKVFGSSYSPQHISTIVEVMEEVVIEFKSRSIEEEYFAIFIDATYVPIRFADTYEKQAIHLVVGINKRGYQDILGYVIGFSESAILWEELLLDLKSRGLKTAEIFVMDGQAGVPEKIRQLFPESDIQRCTVHLMRNLRQKLRKNDRSNILSRVKNLYYMTSKESIELEIENIIADNPNYERILRNYFDIENMFTFLKYPPCVHRTIKTTNRIESVNSKLKTLISHKRIFPNELSLEKFLVPAILEINMRSTRTVAGMEEYIEN